jgi:hypothetical protein
VFSLDGAESDGVAGVGVSPPDGVETALPHPLPV